ncbi:hypothetical protein ACJRO7_016201 [Eucalyptus globulus]|uniref:RING-type E3 ubiquitin transferase n=1 Tax=Eucalyptus globulus TaxID=34317 RepID=A0ABD3LBU4_EUCGL
MATVTSELMTKPDYPIDLMFDLDEALTPVNHQCFCHRKARLEVAVPVMEIVCGITVATAGACAVCMEGFGDPESGGEAKQVLCCGHVYHSTCIATWLSLYSSCPLCRCKIPQEPTPKVSSISKAS